MTQRTRDAVLGAGVLTAILALGWLASRADRPISARGHLLEQLSAAAGTPNDDAVLPLFDALCEGDRIEASPDVTGTFSGSTLLICRHDGGAIGIRQDQITDIPLAGVYPLPGDLLIGGPLGLAGGVMLYWDGEQLRWTTSHRRARELSRSALYKGMLGRAARADMPRLAFGHAGWVAGQLEAEIIAGAWVVLE